MNPPRSRGMLSLVAGVLFALSVTGIVLESRAVITRHSVEPMIAKTNSFGELATAILADATPAKAGTAKTYQCNPGQVQRIKQESKTSPPKPETSTCYINKKETTSARTNEICGFSHPDRCIVQYCYPIASSRDGKSEVCQPVKCQNESGAECFRRAFTMAQKEGPAGMARATALVDPNAGAIVRGPNGELDTSKFLTQALSPDIWKEVEKTDTGDDGDAAEKILKIAQAGLASKPPCDTSSASCRPSLHLNKELKEAHARLNPCASNPAACQSGPGGNDSNERGTLRIPGGAGLPPPPLRPPQQQQQQRPPAPSQSFQCTSAAQPPTPCEGGTWQPQYGAGSCVTGWICAPSGTVGPPPPAPVIALVANPSTIAASSTSVLGWVTVGMQSCLISSPTHPVFAAENANNTSVNGTARTPPLATSTPFVLTCRTASGDTKAATTTVTVTVAAASREAQLASAVLADAVPVPRSAPKAREYGCEAGQVQTLRQASSGVPPKITPSTCFSKDSSGRVARTASAAKDRSCQLSRPDRCVVQYCPPKDALRNNKTGTCFVVSCGSVIGTECLTQTLATIQSEGPVGVIRNTLLADPKTAAVAPGQGVINGNEFLTQALNPTVAAQLRTETGSSAFDRIKGIADAIEKGSAPCNNCTPTLHLNKELATEWARIGQKTPPGPGVQSGPGAQTGLQSDNTGFKFPNITKEPSGTDVLAWMSRLFGADKPKEQQQPPRPGGGGPPCVNVPQPPASQCQGGSWESGSSGSSAESSGGNFSGGSSGACTTNWRCVTPRIISYKAVPESVKSGETANLGWITEGMQSCRISSSELSAWTEENKSYTNVNGTVKSPALTSTTNFVLKCTTKAGTAFAPATTTVGVLP